MTDEISLGKARIILLPIILGLVIIFFLKLFFIKISFWILAVLLILAFLISLLLLIKPDLTLRTSKLPIKKNIKTILGVLLVLVIIISIILLISNLWPSGRQEIYLEKGSFMEKDEFKVPWVCGTVIFKNIDITTKNPDWGFYIGRIQKGESVNVTFTLEDSTQRHIIPFVVNGPSDEYSGTRVSFGTVNRHIGHENPNLGLVYVYVNGVGLSELEETPKYFVTDGQKYNATLKIETKKCPNIVWVRKLDFKL